MNLMPRGGSNVHFLIFPDEHQRERFEAYLNSNKEQIEQLDVSAFRYQIDRDKRIGGRVFSAEKIVRAVSYTHLDVYKRQGMPYAPFESACASARTCPGSRRPCFFSARL